MSTMLDAALAYARQGLAVFPCRPMDKIPLVPRGFHEASKDEEQVRAWWEKWPQANIGLPTGAGNGLVVIDYDEKSGGLEALEELGISCPPDSSVNTGGGGRHQYFAHPGSNVRNKAGWRQGVDIRGDGGYVIAPPSVHASGNVYAWAAGDGAGLTFLPSLPPWAAEELQATPVAPSAASFQDAENDNSVGEGQRNAYLTSWAGRLWKQGMSEDALLAALQAENEARCSPPLPSSEVEAICGWIATKPAGESVAASLPETSPSLVVRAGDIFEKTLSYLTDKSKVKGTPTGLDGLDRMLGGGFRLGEVTCWHAEAKTGKNTLWHLLMFYGLEAGIPQGYASRELTPEEEVLPNLFCLKTLENAWKADVTAARAKAWGEAATSWPLYFAEGYGVFELDAIDRWMDELQAMGVWNFWMDHLHYMLSDPEDHKAASKLIKEIKTRAKQRKIHVNIIIQPNKLMDGQKLSLNSIKGGAAMGQAIDNLLIMERQKNATDASTDARLNVSKLTLEVARSKLCKPGSIYLQYDTENTTFVECEGPEALPEPPRMVERSRTVAKAGWGYKPIDA